MYDLIVIGGGPAGLAAALAAWKKGLKKILIVERDTRLGGILNQCIHNGFGLHHFKEELTGPEYAGRFIEELRETGVEVRLDTMVLEIGENRRVCMISRERGYCEETATSVVLAMGCRERSRGAIGTPGTRPAGVYTAGAAQRYVNIEGWLPGKRVVILGSGDIGLIMARRMTLEGAKVLACVEVMPFSSGLTRNIVQCLNDYDIPLYLSHTVTEIRGEKRVEQVVVSEVDANRRPVPGTEIVFDCDTLLLSVGLIPENELTRKAGAEIDKRTGGIEVFENMETTLPGVFACGNVCHVHDLVDFVTEEGMLAGESAADYALGIKPESSSVITVRNGNGVGYTVPQKMRNAADRKAFRVFFRANRVFGKCTLAVRSGNTQIAAYKKERLSPGEMEQITLPKALLDNADGEIVLEVRDDE